MTLSNTLTRQHAWGTEAAIIWSESCDELRRNLNMLRLFYRYMCKALYKNVTLLLLRKGNVTIQIRNTNMKMSVYHALCP